MNYLDELKERNAFFSSKDENSLDKLTGVINREAIFEYINFLIENGRKFALLEVDIDNFKYINDTFGHLIGDKVLESVVKRILSLVGDDCTVGRFGGDEFIMIYEDAYEYEDVWNLGHRFSEGFLGLRIKEINEKTLSCTLGVARYPKDATNINELFETADKALYRGKTKGRNCFIIYLPEKHKDIDLSARKDIRLGLSYIISESFNFLNKEGDYKTNIKNLFDFLVEQLQVDHISLQTENGMLLSTVNTQISEKKFQFLPNGFFRKRMTSNIFYVNNINEYKTVYPDLAALYSTQEIQAQMVGAITFRDKDYGCIRFDVVRNRRIWQNEEVILLTTIANIIARDLYYNNLTLEKL